MTHAPNERCPVHALCPECAVIARDALMAHVGLEPMSATRERAAVVAWLRAEMEDSSTSVRGTLGFAADAIERGEHRHKEEP
jgi:hypothetical protein